MTKNNYISIALFIVVFSFFTLLLKKVYINNNKDKKLETNLAHLDKEKDKYDILFLSNSFLYTTYDPLYLEYLTGLHSIHLGTSARRFCFEPYIIKKVVEKQKPKLIVLDISSSTLKIPTTKKSWYFNSKPMLCFDGAFVNKNKLEELTKTNFKSSILNNIKQEFKFFFNPQFKKTFKEFDKLNKKNKEGTLGFVAKIKPNKSKLKKYKKTFNKVYNYTPTGNKNISKMIDKESELILNDLINWFKNNKEYNLLLVNSIKIDSRSENQYFLNQLKEKVKTIKNIKILELNTKTIKEKLNLKLNDFFNPTHLSITGSLKVTNVFSNFIKENYSFINKEVKKPLKFIVKKTKKEILVKGVYLFFEKNQNPDIRIILDTIQDKTLKKYNTVVNIFPKKEYKNRLTNKAKKNKWKSDNAYKKIESYEIIDGELVAKINTWTKLKKDQIDHIDLFFYDGKSNKTNTITFSLE